MAVWANGFWDCGHVHLPDSSGDQWKAVAENDDPLLAMEERLEAYYLERAGERQYTSLANVMARTGYPNAWREECQDFAQWADACRASWYVVVHKVNNSLLTLPTFDQLLAGFPQLTWPAPVLTNPATGEVMQSIPPEPEPEEEPSSSDTPAA